MIFRLLVPVAALVFAGAVATPSQAATMKECAAQWQDAKKNNTTGGKAYRDFSKECMAKDAGASPAATTDTKPAATKPADTKATTAKPDDSKAADGKPASKMSPGRQAMVERERACGAEWKADKEAGKIEKGLTWPKYWSACNTKKKAAGM